MDGGSGIMGKENKSIIGITYLFPWGQISALSLLEKIWCNQPATAGLIRDQCSVLFFCWKIRFSAAALTGSDLVKGSPSYWAPPWPWFMSPLSKHRDGLGKRLPDMHRKSHFDHLVKSQHGTQICHLILCLFRAVQLHTFSFNLVISNLPMDLPSLPMVPVFQSCSSNSLIT
jgi:hypothetical protein